MTPEPAEFTSPIAEKLSRDLLERFLRYVRVDTQSARDQEDSSPSTPGQLDLLGMLVDELRELGLQDAELDRYGYVMATLPANGDGDAPTIGLLAHVDVSPDAPAEGVEPIVHSVYDGGPIELPRGATVLDPTEMPGLAKRAGHDVVTSSGDTLLGADDKAGVAEIMAAVAYLVAHPELPRPKLRIGFTPDEEIGQGPRFFDVDYFGAACAYTLDGSEPGELQDETFNAVEVRVVVHGVDAHPGWAKDVLVNAARLAARIVVALPSDELTPETTDGREGFIHPYIVNATGTRAEVRAIVRDFDQAKLEEHVELIRRTAEEVLAAEPRASFELEVKEQYPNMRRHLADFPQVVEAAERAIRAEGLEPVREPIRGGTDGALLSARGLPTPNLFTGGHDYHSVREWASLQEMAAAAATVVRLAGVWAEIGGDGR